MKNWDNSVEVSKKNFQNKDAHILHRSGHFKLPN